MITAAGAATSVVSATKPQDAAALAYVSGYDLTPGVFYPDETGTLTVHVTNAANTSVTISQPDLIDPNVDVINKGAFATSTSIGPGATVDYTFVIRFDGPDRALLPLFTVSTNAWGTSAIHTQIKLKVDSTEVRTSVSKKPDIFSLEKMDTVDVSIVNPRLGDISDVLITASSPGNDMSPSEEYVESIQAGTSVKVPFDITPHQQSDVTFNVSFRNGDNVHTTSVVLPLNIGVDKSAAVLVINNIALIGNAGAYTMTGDVGNAGIPEAQAVVISVGAPAMPVGQYQNYLIGSLASNDFTRFTLAFTSNDLSAVPVQVQWKDPQGNTRSSITTLDLRTLAVGGPIESAAPYPVGPRQVALPAQQPVPAVSAHSILSSRVVSS
ncbi:MAG: hypothetical protein WC620_05570 [Methanoregula sp.]|jgi:hypothetical protein